MLGTQFTSACFVLAATLAGAQPRSADGPGGGERVVGHQAAAVTLDDLARVAGLDAGELAARLRRERSAASAGADFALIFCTIHRSYEARASTSGFTRSSARPPVDPLFD